MNLSDRELLARMIQAEAGNQGELGMRAVAAVMDNRRRAQGYGGNTFRDVLLAPGQFSPANSITGYAGGEQGVDLNQLQASQTAYAVADAVMGGNLEDPTGGALNFLNPDISQPSWLSTMGNTVKIGDHLFGTAGSGEGSSGRPGGAAMRLLGGGNSAATGGAGNDTLGGTMPIQNQPQGLLGSLGIQKRDEAAGGETAQPFYQRDTFKDTAAVLAQGFGRMGIMGMEEIADDIAKQRTENKARNKTLEYLSKMPNGDQLVELAEVAGPRAVAEFVMKQRLGGGSEDPAEIRTLKYRAEAAGLTPGTPEYQKFMLTGGGSEGGSGPAAYEALRLRARDAGLDPGTPEYQQFMRTGGTGDTVASQEQKDEAKRTADEQKDLAFFAAGERALSAINEDTFVPATGVVADFIKDTPFGQAQTDVAENLAIMESQMQFETLANLKAASPNGSSGLGQLTEAERRALGKLYANFDNRQSEPAVARAINSSMLMRAYFKNGLYDPTMETPGYRNATPQELDQMAQGINPFADPNGPQLKGVKGFDTPTTSGGAQKTKTGVTYKVLD